MEKIVVTMSSCEYKRFLAFKKADEVVRNMKKGFEAIRDAKRENRKLKSAYQLADEL
jgi:hypothetical protein